MGARADIIATWAAEWEPRLLARFDRQLAAADPSYSEGWIFVEATDEANADLDRRLAVLPASAA